ncbi:hypothetical protein [Methanosphaerula palustris]|uniref:Uncharacterized protein n=1 Tax=Methanosphaerula palustris (strain ATCC BAA-1556 / DSM 19958 / E1-9c) TaxID=521011 RepID=B8GJU8_METPE|nr:hypothetical protein [Methanosphaerula palustris]ACL15752.1 hypothetical protein Mpal_0375 [Methanosphaerula palustris E1-9c]
MPSNETQDDRLPLRIVQPADLPVLNVDGILGGLDPSQARILLYADRPEMTIAADGSMTPAAVVRMFLAELRMSPETFVSIACWMGTQAARYEACSAVADDEEMDQKPV